MEGTGDSAASEATTSTSATAATVATAATAAGSGASEVGSSPSSEGARGVDNARQALDQILRLPADRFIRGWANALLRYVMVCVGSRGIV